jgi:zinc transport system substrate-binding protein
VQAGQEESGHSHSVDPHIWTSPVLAMKMVEHIASALIEADPANEDYYRENADSYLKKLNDLDQTFRQIVSEASCHTIYVGSRFSLYYFAREYGLSYVAAYDSCEEEAEPSIKRVLSMISSMREEKIPAVYYEELTEPYVANTIAEAADAEALLFHSCHNVSLSELESGATYLSLMEQNAINLKKGLEQ